MIKVAISDILDGKLDDLNTFEHYVYVVRDADIVLYVGQASDPIDRIKGHCGQGTWGWGTGESPLGTLILHTPNVARECRIELLTLADCEPAIVQHCPEYTVRDATVAELALIRALRPCLNTIHNQEPPPIPARYEQRPTDSSARYLPV